ncbi:toll-like receptor 13 [Tachyglossus aculeatus]|uniref:toll-like receptor 13 n=1 Tax=Tachyglossus aculeatus TaxID=9261 RepID=UPI0018F39338|nr:toll-like receptor 13 [Tachyglossus aculeatus]
MEPEVPPPPRWLDLLLAGLALLSLARAYGFRKCAQYELDVRHVICIHKSISNLSEAVGELPAYTTHLNLSHNSLRALPPRGFAHLPGLEDLRLEWNYISYISPGAFGGLGNLTLLNLVENRLVTVNDSSFLGLSRLRTLLLNHNRIATIQERAFAPPVDLRLLNLSRNCIADLPPIVAALGGLRRLEVLDLSRNNISTLRGCSGTPPALAELRLRNNSLRALDFSSWRPPNLTSLDVSLNLNLSDVRLDGLPRLTSLNLSITKVDLERLGGRAPPSLRALDLSFTLPNLSSVCGLLGRLPRLETLGFRGNGVTARDVGSLANCSGPLRSLDLGENSALTGLADAELDALPGLERLSLKGSQLSQVSNASWGALRNLTVLDLSLNQLKGFPDRTFGPLGALRFLDLSRNPLVEVAGAAFSGLGALRELHLAGCWVVAIRSTSFAPFPNLELLNLRENNIRTLKKNTFRALGKLRLLTLSQNRLGAIQRGAFRGLSGLRHLDLAYNIFTGFHHGAFEGLEGLEVLDLSFNKITYETTRRDSPFARLSALRRLNLEGQLNGIQVIPRDFFQGLGGLRELLLGKNSAVFLDSDQLDPLTNLTSLDISGTRAGERGLFLNPRLFRLLGRLARLRLENNNLEALGPGLFSGLKSLRILSLRFNSLKAVGRDQIHDLPALRFLDLFGNRLDCTCDNLWFKNWAVGNASVQVPYLGSYACSQPDASSLLVDFDDPVCNYELGKVYFLCSSSLVLATLAGALLSSKLTWWLRYGLYVVRTWTEAGWKREDRPFAYDAFVSFAAADERWVYEELVPALERDGRPAFRLCLHHRDFEPGADIFENIQAAVDTSRKTLCVVSRHYLRSEWCRLEVQLASVKTVYDRRDVVILIFLEDVPTYRLSGFHRLRKLVKKQTFITWPEDPGERPLFWARIRNALANRTVGAGEEGEDEDEPLVVA